MEKRLDEEAKINLKFCDVTTWETITIYILPNISRTKLNQTMKYDYLIEYNIFFFENHAKYGAEKLVPDLLCFFKKLYMK